MLRLAFIGAGNMGQAAHLQNYIARDDCEVVGIAELRPGQRQLVASRYGIRQHFEDHRQLLAAIGTEIDGIVASQPFRLHRDLVPELLAAGKPVLTEKPIAATLEAAAQLAQLSADSATPYFIGYHKRSDPAILAARAQMQAWQRDGSHGALRYIRLTMPPGDWIANGFLSLVQASEERLQLPGEARGQTPEAKAYDAFVNYYIHQINLLRHLLGCDYRVVGADAAGITCTVMSADGVPALLEMEPWRTSVDWQEQVLIAFQHGWLRVDLPAPLAHRRPGQLTVYSDPPGGQPQELRPQLPWVHAMAQQAAFFCAACRGEDTPLCRAAEAVADLHSASDYLQVLQAARQAQV